MNVLLTPKSYTAIDAKLDGRGVFAKQFTQMVGGKVATVGMRVGAKPGHVVAFFGDRILLGKDGVVSVLRAAAVSAARWNHEYPIGIRVVAYPGFRPGVAPGLECKCLETVTRTPAWELGHGQPVVSIEGYPGGIALTHVDVIGGAL
ncbi:hypothetical protein [Streptacidiphilus sp. PAMC 29251]